MLVCSGTCIDHFHSPSPSYCLLSRSAIICESYEMAVTNQAISIFTLQGITIKLFAIMVFRNVCCCLGFSQSLSTYMKGASVSTKSLSNGITYSFKQYKINQGDQLKPKKKDEMEIIQKPLDEIKKYTDPLLQDSAHSIFRLVLPQVASQPNVAAELER